MSVRHSVLGLVASLLVGLVHADEPPAPLYMQASEASRMAMIRVLRGRIDAPRWVLTVSSNDGIAPLSGSAMLGLRDPLWVGARYSITPRLSGGFEHEWGAVRALDSAGATSRSRGAWALEVPRGSSAGSLRGLLTFKLNQQESISLRPSARTVMLTYHAKLR